MKLEIFVVAVSVGVLGGEAADVKISDLGGYVGARMRGCYETAVRGADTETLVGVFRTRVAAVDGSIDIPGRAGLYRRGTHELALAL